MREFTSGDEVLVLLPMQDQPLAARFRGPYSELKRDSYVNYVTATPDRRKSERMCHVNLLKLYNRREVAVTADVINVSDIEPDECKINLSGEWEENSQERTNLTDKLSHLRSGQ